MTDTILFAGAGLSAAAHIPTTRQLTKHFLALGPTSATPEPLQSAITRQLADFWQEVFGYEKGSEPPPTFEEHFTTIDLAANAGHNLGTSYWPRRLRAIRRLSIHRVFDVLDSAFRANHKLENLLARLAAGTNNAVITTNWDISIEKHLENGGNTYSYGLPVDTIYPDTPMHAPLPETGLPILKLHGSSNWAYCDCCRRLYSFPSRFGKGTLHSWTFLEARDFAVLPGRGSALKSIWTQRRPAKCSRCNVRLGARVATFSFEKALGFNQFQAVWEESLRRLRAARRWIFVGYSLPDSDFELRQMLKTAQLADRKRRTVAVHAIVGADAPAAKRFQRFFGAELTEVRQKTFDSWYRSWLPET